MKPSRIKPMPDTSYFTERLHCCPLSGRLYWKHRPLSHFGTTWGTNRWNTRYAGKETGSVGVNGHSVVVVDKRHYMTHRLIWAMTNGPIPDGMEVDHINGKRNDNRIHNLRLVTQAQQAINKGMSKSNTTGHTGVYFYKPLGKWFAAIRVDGRLKSLGYFDDLNDAVAARQEGVNTYYGEYARQNN